MQISPKAGPTVPPNPPVSAKSNPEPWSNPLLYVLLVPPVLWLLFR
jgi:hypothetical protein